jgi:hypothetical protein
MNGVGQIFPASCMSSNLSVPVFPKEHQLPGYAFRTVTKYLRSLSRPWQNEDDVAAQLVGFLQQFLEIFSELKGKKFYLTGESVRTDISHLTIFKSDIRAVRGDVCAM